MNKKTYMDAIAAIVKSMEAYVSRKLSKASFDRTVDGVVTAVDGTKMTCTVQVDGKAHQIKVPSCPFSAGESVEVLVPCNNWRRASVLGSKLKQLNNDIKNHGNVLTANGTRASIYHEYITLCTLDLPPGIPFIVFGSVVSSISNATGIISAILGNRTTRTTMNYGGGCIVYEYFPSGGTVSLKTYGYVDSKYELIGNITAIRLK